MTSVAVGRVFHENTYLEIPIIKIGSEDLTKPCLALISGVHGLEKIGVDVVLNCVRTIAALASWDRQLQDALKRCRIVFYPFVNPVGLKQNSRCNGSGVDIMRNAPLDSVEAKKYQLYAGHRLSSRLPWYRGKVGDSMQAETTFLIEAIQEHVLSSEFAICVDFHSGFGLRDRLWFPFAYSKELFPDISWIYFLKNTLKQSFPHHVYKIEPQSHSYSTHGDVWDFLYLKHQKENSEKKIFLPLTLEMGSWLWLKKNPQQILAPLGTFNPLIPHRRKRTLRRHWSLIDFLIRFVSSIDQLQPLHQAQEKALLGQAKDKWGDLRK